MRWVLSKIAVAPKVGFQLFNVAHGFTWISGEPYDIFVSECLASSSIANAMKTLYESLKASSIACITLHSLPLELQLPPYLDRLLHSDEDIDDAQANFLDEEDVECWGEEFRYGWRVPSLAPWKSLLLLERDGDEEGADPLTTLREGAMELEDQGGFVDGLVKFLENASVTVSLVDMAGMLDWDLETQVFPIVRWLVLHRRAKVVDLVHESLKTVFTLPPKFDQRYLFASTSLHSRF
jgi:nitrogen permease regulator 3-like protein